jgi:hypothetical protein
MTFCRKLDFSNEDILYVVHNIFRGRSVLVCTIIPRLGCFLSGRHLLHGWDFARAIS